MGVVQIRVEVCDVCGDREKPVEKYRLAPPGGRLKTYALCADDAVPVLEMLKQLEPTHRVGRTVKPVASMEEVTAARKQPARKRATRKV